MPHHLRCHFDEDALDTLDLLIYRKIPSGSEDLPQLLRDLQDKSCLKIWRASLDSLIDYLGALSNSNTWRQAKQRALDILIQRDVVAEAFDNLLFLDSTDTIEALKFIDIINEKIRLMDRFAVVYDAQPAPDAIGNQSTEPTYNFIPRDDESDKTVTKAYPNISQHIRRSHP